MNLEGAIRGARNPLSSWSRIDSSYDTDGNYILGQNDLDLAKRLCKAGSDHRKFIRQIIVSVDITAPLYWWKEFDTYKVATVANSTSTMHKPVSYTHLDVYKRQPLHSIIIFSSELFSLAILLSTTLFPQLGQNFVSSLICTPQFLQNIVYSLFS